VICIDLVLLWWLWRKILSGRWPDDRRPRLHWVWPILGFAAAVAAILFSVAIATFPGEGLETLLAKWDKPRLAVSLHDWIFNGAFDSSTGRRRSMFSATPILPTLNIYDGLKIDDPAKTSWRNYVFVAGQRDLRGAIFDSALLPKVDFTGARLQGASFLSAQLQGASFNGAQLQGTLFQNAQLQGASLFSAQLQGASLASAQLQGANLQFAQLPGGGERSFRAHLSVMPILTLHHWTSHGSRVRSSK
jgi:hypothetical protein